MRIQGKTSTAAAGAALALARRSQLEPTRLRSRPVACHRRRGSQQTALEEVGALKPTTKRANSLRT